MNSKNIYKLIVLAVMLLLLIPFTSVVYFTLYSINNFYPETYQRYATAGKYEKNIFLDKEVNEKTNVYESINCVDFAEAIKDHRIQTACKIINKNKNLIREKLINNEKYMDYLKDNNLTVEDFFSYTEKIEVLDDNFIKFGFFISWLLIIYVCVVKFDWRRKFYFFSGLVYLFHVLSQFTGILSQNLLYYTLLTGYVTYDNFIATGPLVFDALTESCLTFIIFDYLFQIYGNRSNVIIDNFLVDLDIILDKIESRRITPAEVHTLFIRNTRKFINICNKEIRKHNIHSSLNKIFGHLNYFDKELNSLMITIKEEIGDILRLKQGNINGYDKKIKNLRWKILILRKKYY